MSKDKIVKIGICSPEDVMYDSTFVQEFIKYLEDNLEDNKELNNIKHESL